MVEKIGSGIRRIKELMHEAKLPAPEYRTEGMFTVVFKRPRKRKMPEGTVEETVEEIIFNLIKDNPQVTAKEMTESTNLSRRGVEYQLDRLKKSGKLERIGSTKSGYWRIKEQ